MCEAVEGCGVCVCVEGMEAETVWGAVLVEGREGGEQNGAAESGGDVATLSLDGW